MKLGGVVVYDLLGLDPELPSSPSLCLPVPSIGKRPRGNHQGKGGWWMDSAILHGKIQKGKIDWFFYWERCRMFEYLPKCDSLGNILGWFLTRGQFLSLALVGNHNYDFVTATIIKIILLLKLILLGLGEVLPVLHLFWTQNVRSSSKFRTKSWWGDIRIMPGFIQNMIFSLLWTKKILFQNIHKIALGLYMF